MERRFAILLSILLSGRWRLKPRRRLPPQEFRAWAFLRSRSLSIGFLQALFLNSLDIAQDILQATSG